MIKLFSTLFFITCFTFVFSQESSKNLSEKEKQALREKHKSGLNFKSNNSNNKGNVNVTGSKEEKIDKTTTVKYYHGTQDTLYKEYKYKKPD